MWVGGILASPLVSPLADHFGRKNALYASVALTTVAVIIQSAAQNIAMFIVARCLIGLGVSLSGAIAPIYLSETIQAKWRGPVLGCIYTFWYIGL
jgi:MFS family permease